MKNSDRYHTCNVPGKSEIANWLVFIFALYPLDDISIAVDFNVSTARDISRIVMNVCRIRNLVEKYWDGNTFKPNLTEIYTFWPA